MTILNLARQETGDRRNLIRLVDVGDRVQWNTGKGNTDNKQDEQQAEPSKRSIEKSASVTAVASCLLLHAST